MGLSYSRHTPKISMDRLRILFGLAGLRHEYNKDLGTAHSMFFEAFVGGGVLALVALVLLSIVTGIYAVRLLHYRESQIAFTVSMMFAATLMFGSIGADIGYGPLGITFWSLCAMLPIVHGCISHSRSPARVKPVALGRPPRHDNQLEVDSVLCGAYYEETRKSEHGIKRSTTGMKETQRISIVTPSFEQAQFLEECLESVQCQDYAGVEHIVMDGASTDGRLRYSGAIPESLADGHLQWRSRT